MAVEIKKAYCVLLQRPLQGLLLGWEGLKYDGSKSTPEWYPLRKALGLYSKFTPGRDNIGFEPSLKKAAGNAGIPWGEYLQANRART